MTKECMKRYSTSLLMRKKYFSTKMRYHFAPTSMDKIMYKITSIGEFME